MSAQKLTQVLAVEKGLKSARERTVTAAYQLLQKPALFEGQQRTYEPLADLDDKLPPERTPVQARVPDKLREIRQGMTEIIDLIATRDGANCVAKADVVVGSTTLATNVPGVTLLAVEKQLNDLKTIINAAPVLDPAEEWIADDSQGLYRTDPKRTVRTKKIARPIVLIQPTEKHPGQAQLIQEDINAGHWAAQRFSGALSRTDKEQLIARVEAVEKAVKYAREQCNLTEAPPVKLADKLLAHIFG